MHTGNPALSEKVVSEYLVAPREQVRTMTVAGTAIKTFVLLAFLVAGGSWGWSSATTAIPADIGGGYGNTTVTIPGGFWLASIGAFVVAMVVIVNPRRAALLGIVYALLEGYCLGAISAAFEAQTEGIVGAAVLSTVCVFVVALFLYVTRIVRPTRRMAFAVTAGIGGLLLLYLFVAILSIFDWTWLYSDEFRAIGVVVSLDRDRARRAQPDPRLRHHRGRRRGGRPEVHGVVLRVRARRDPGLALPHHPAAPRPALRQPLSALSPASRRAPTGAIAAWRGMPIVV